MSTPQIQRTYPRTDDRPFAVEFHLQGCTCDACTQIPDAPLPWAKLAIAGAFTGNLIAFAWDPAGSWSTLSSAVRHLIGAL